MTNRELEVVKSHVEAAQASLSAAYRVSEDALRRFLSRTEVDTDAQWLMDRLKSAARITSECWQGAEGTLQDRRIDGEQADTGE